MGVSVQVPYKLLGPQEDVSLQVLDKFPRALDRCFS